MGNLKNLINQNFLEFANYVVKDRAIPDIMDGFKPVQRRVLYSMFRMDDGRFNKVANIVGHTMQFHPHGDNSISDALVSIANKELFIERQGNFGNILTGDRAAAARYIEARLTPLAKEVLFNKDITEYIDSYDRRNLEPLVFPAKIPVLLLMGVEGIAVGMSTKIMPHNFNEVLKAQVSYLQGKEFQLFPDFPQGGIIDVSEYNDGNGKIKVRAVIEQVSDKKLVIRELPFGTTTESIIASVEKQSKRGKIRIASINDYTTDKVEIEINLARGYTSDGAIGALYAFTDCEKPISPSLLSIHDKVPVIHSVTEILKFTTDILVKNLERELKIKLDSLLEKYHAKTLAQIFIENRIYKKIEELIDYNMILNTVKDSFMPFEKKFIREVSYEDVEKLLQLQIKRISRFDINKNQEELDQIQLEIDETKHNLGRIVDFTIDYIKALLKKYGRSYKRRSKIDQLETIKAKDAAIENIRLYYDRANGYLGTNLKSEEYIMVSEFSHVLLMFRNGIYKVVRVAKKDFIGNGLQYFEKADTADELTFSVIYRNKAKNHCYIKRFDEVKYILDKEYRFYPDKCKLEYFTTRHNLHFDCDLEVTPRMRTSLVELELEDYHAKGIGASGNRLTNKNIIKIKARKSEIYPKEENGEIVEGVDNDDIEIAEVVVEEPKVVELKAEVVEEKPKVVKEVKPKKTTAKKGKKEKADTNQPDLFAATEEFLKGSSKDTKKKK
ncbi:MAG: DNA topoisomerase IV subunit A [Candidatus Delongbacteria bacterium]|jgi:topoisomerase-4 subunit A|nr:DNA topoisomerase IV subunit A [Candidatus Delongbacteria bacterium]